jgi:hypothetical protein
MVDRGHRWRSSPAQAQTGVNVSENCYNSQSSSEQVNCDSAVGYPLPYLFKPGVTPWERGRPARVASLRAGCSRSQEKCERLPFTSTPSDSVRVFSRAAVSVIAGRERAGMPAHPAGGDARAPGGRGRPRTRQERGAILRQVATERVGDGAAVVPAGASARSAGGCRTCASDR